jgi:hypothetical protein
MHYQKYIISGCNLDDVVESMNEILEGMQVRFELPVELEWNVIGKNLDILFKSKSKEMSDEEFVFDQVWDEVIGAFEMSDEEITFKNVPVT